MKDRPLRMLGSSGDLVRDLLRWYDGVVHIRDMPWRRTRDPYAIWLSETMLQQTQVATVKGYFERFLARFPTVQALAAAELEEVLALWAGLGYYRRAKFLHAAAKVIAAEHRGILPGSADALRALPGIGRYTAGAIASIAFGAPEPVVDGNVMRVLSRLTGFSGDIAATRQQEFFWETAQAILLAAKTDRYGDINQSLMELGATVCTPGRPICDSCPVKNFCRAAAEGRQEELPVKSSRGAVLTVRGRAVVMLRKKDTEVLMMQRPQGGVWEGMWEFPVLPPKVRGEGGSTSAIIRKALGTKGTVAIAAGKVRHQLSHRTIIYDVYICRWDVGMAALPACGNGRYVAAKWLRWPLHERGELPMARLVHKIAQRAAARASM